MDIISSGCTQISYERYPNVQTKPLVHADIHEVRNSFVRMSQLSTSGKTPDRASYEGTHWLKFIQVLLQTSNLIVSYLSRNKSVLVHCETGSDITAQLVSLVQILVDPFFRTIHGFEILIQKEWLQFGHQFSSRVGHGQRDGGNHNSPIFVQFIDAVYQLITQYPNWFEFNATYLIAILDELYNGRFGTFFMNSEKEREEIKLSEQTHSLWTWLADPMQLERYINFEYKMYKNILIPTCSTSHLSVWIGYYGRYRAQMYHHKLHIEYTQRHATVHHLESENALLRRQLEEEVTVVSKFESQLKEQIYLKKNTLIRILLEQEIDKAVVNGKLPEPLVVEVEMEKGKLIFQLQRKPPEPTTIVAGKEVVNLDNYRGLPMVESTCHESYEWDSMCDEVFGDAVPVDGKDEIALKQPVVGLTSYVITACNLVKKSVTGSNHIVSNVTNLTRLVNCVNWWKS
eukprot:TRINITY_DN3539_c1_g1_i1.p1 TRINITY_DN3539_c1_g1~~TRINITY_DN3539_c1_g1_i1.p1  ORF type:complete len:530 (+),score=106.43 TRINITY_DN3539_c1_g1_i1:220-1590(+)